MAQKRRCVLVYGPGNAGKSTFLATAMDPGPNGASPRWGAVDYYDYDNSSPSIAKYFRDGGPGRHIEVIPGEWEALNNSLKQSVLRAQRGEIDAIVFDGLSQWYRDDLGLEGAKHPEAIDAGGNASLKTRVPSSNRLGTIVAMLHRVSKIAKRKDFLVLITVHTKEQGDMNAREIVPDISTNQWMFLYRLCEVVIELQRVGGGAPRVIYKDAKHQFHRIKNPDALAYFDKIHAARDEARIAQMRTIPGLVGLLEHVEAKAAKAAADLTAPVQNDDSSNQQTTENIK